MSSAPVRVLVVDDSPVSRELLTGLFNADPALQVVGLAADGEAAVAAAQRLRPDVITMDIHLPKLDGFAATRQIMQSWPTRIVMVTANSIPNDVAASFRTLESGALAVLAKPPGPGHPLFDHLAQELVHTVKLMAEVQVVRRWTPFRAVPAPSTPATADVRLVAMGASTGGPLVLKSILSLLRPGFPVPVVIVQHFSPGFADGFAQWLAQACGHPVRVAQHGDRAQSGLVYVAPDGRHMKLRAGGEIVLCDEPPEHGMRPSVASLFRSVAHGYGAHAAGVLLTGMGRDGAQELKAMRDAGALTIVQDQASAVVYGMPAEAMRLDAAQHVLDPPAIAATLNQCVRRLGA
jgi:two-component system, chemotaxis family, protein-glutamate methylesterase/glutaminase